MKSKHLLSAQYIVLTLATFAIVLSLFFPDTFAFISTKQFSGAHLYDYALYVYIGVIAAYAGMLFSLSGMTTENNMPILHIMIKYYDVYELLVPMLLQLALLYICILFYRSIVLHFIFTLGLLLSIGSLVYILHNLSKILTDIHEYYNVWKSKFRDELAKIIKKELAEKSLVDKLNNYITDEKLCITNFLPEGEYNLILKASLHFSGYISFKGLLNAIDDLRRKNRYLTKQKAYIVCNLEPYECYSSEFDAFELWVLKTNYNPSKVKAKIGKLLSKHAETLSKTTSDRCIEDEYKALMNNQYDAIYNLIMRENLQSIELYIRRITEVNTFFIGSITHKIVYQDYIDNIMTLVLSEDKMNILKVVYSELIDSQIRVAEMNDSIELYTDTLEIVSGHISKEYSNQSWEYLIRSFADTLFYSVERNWRSLEQVWSVEERMIEAVTEKAFNLIYNGIKNNEIDRYQSIAYAIQKMHKISNSGTIDEIVCYNALVLIARIICEYQYEKWSSIEDKIKYIKHMMMQYNLGKSMASLSLILERLNYQFDYLVKKVQPDSNKMRYRYGWTWYGSIIEYLLFAMYIMVDVGVVENDNPDGHYPKILKAYNKERYGGFVSSIGHEKRAYIFIEKIIDGITEIDK